MSSAQKIIQAAAGNAAGEATYVESVFSTYLYTGDGSVRSITNGVDLDGEGGAIWFKKRSATQNHAIFSTNFAPDQYVETNNTNALRDVGDGGLESFNSDGFTFYPNTSYFNQNGADYVSWTFRKAPKFFDVVTYTGTGSARTVAHNLGSVPGCIIVKRTDTTGDWQVYHRANTANPETDYLVLNSTAATADSNTRWNDTAPTDALFTVGTEATVNASGGTYVAYLFAHNDGDGEFGENADQDIIKCGSYVGGSSNTNQLGNLVNLGWEPQLVLVKAAQTTPFGDQPWMLFDNMRGMAVGGFDPFVSPNTSDAEDGTNNYIELESTGFRPKGGAKTNQQGLNYIYIAIRRGPMKTPESGTEVFDLALEANGPYSVGFPADSALFKWRDGTQSWFWKDRLRGDTAALSTNTTSAEGNSGGSDWDLQDSFDDSVFVVGDFYMQYYFRRAPGFFDVVAYEGTGSTQAISHNLGVTPELMISRRRDGTAGWSVYSSALGATQFLRLHSDAVPTTLSSIWNDTAPSATEFTVGSTQSATGGSYIQYLFATLPGVSKVGSYTGNGSSQTIDCGFSTGARFVLTKRTNSTGNWNVWDSERGIVAGNDPRLELNTTDAEDTGHDYIDPDSSGFIVNYVADDDDDSNVNGDEYIFLAIS